MNECECLFYYQNLNGLYQKKVRTKKISAIDDDDKDAQIV